VDGELHHAAAARCRKTCERRFSLTDAISLELMARRKIIEAIAQDEHFVREKVVMHDANFKHPQLEDPR